MTRRRIFHKRNKTQIFYLWIGETDSPPTLEFLHIEHPKISTTEKQNFVNVFVTSPRLAYSAASLSVILRRTMVPFQYARHTIIIIINNNHKHHHHTHVRVKKKKGKPVKLIIYLLIQPLYSFIHTYQHRIRNEAPLR